jgi:hypothetical protein
MTTNAQTRSQIKKTAREIVDIVFDNLDRDCDWIIGRDHAEKQVERLLAQLEARERKEAK